MNNKKKLKISKTGYKSNSKDKNEPSLIIPSNHITMQGVPYPVRGIDNLGNEIIMHPGEDYLFPGDFVLETPIMQSGGNVQYVTNPNDPRLIAYQDSAILYNATQPIYDISTNRRLTPSKNTASTVRKNVIGEKNRMSSGISNYNFNGYGDEYPAGGNVKKIGYFKNDPNDRYMADFIHNKIDAAGRYSFEHPKYSDYSTYNYVYQRPVQPIALKGSEPIKLYAGKHDVKSVGTTDPNLSIGVRFKQLGLNSDFKTRKEWAIKAGIENYSGSAEQNKLLNKWMVENYGKDQKSNQENIQPSNQTPENQNLVINQEFDDSENFKNSNNEINMSNSKNKDLKVQVPIYEDYYEKHPVFGYPVRKTRLVQGVQNVSRGTTNTNSFQYGGFLEPNEQMDAGRAMYESLKQPSIIQKVNANNYQNNVQKHIDYYLERGPLKSNNQSYSDKVYSATLADLNHHKNANERVLNNSAPINAFEKNHPVWGGDLTDYMNRIGSNPYRLGKTLNFKYQEGSEFVDPLTENSIDPTSIDFYNGVQQSTVPVKYQGKYYHHKPATSVNDQERYWMTIKDRLRNAFGSKEKTKGSKVSYQFEEGGSYDATRSTESYVSNNVNNFLQKLQDNAKYAVKKDLVKTANFIKQFGGDIEQSMMQSADPNIIPQQNSQDPVEILMQFCGESISQECLNAAMESQDPMLMQAAEQYMSMQSQGGLEQPNDVEGQPIDPSMLAMPNQQDASGGMMPMAQSGFEFTDEQLRNGVRPEIQRRVYTKDDMLYNQDLFNNNISNQHGYYNIERYEDEPLDFDVFEINDVISNSEQNAFNKAWRKQKRDFNKNNITDEHVVRAMYAAPMALTGLKAIQNLTGISEDRNKMNYLKDNTLAHNVYQTNQGGYRGDYLTNAQGSNFRPNQHTFGNFGKIYQEGGEMEMSDEEIAQFLAAGGKIEYLD